MATSPIPKEEFPKEEVIIDPNGDIALEIGNTRLIVSSRVLRLVSPVFDTMLNPHSQEGGQLYARGRWTIPLEEDAAAFTTFCKAIHHYAPDQIGTPPVAELKQIAIICTKYQCGNTFYYHISMWLRNRMDSPMLDLFEMLAIAYALDLPEAFSSISAKIVHEHPGVLQLTRVFVDHPLLNHDLMTPLGLHRAKRGHEFQSLLLRPLPAPNLQLQPTLPCAATTQVTGAYIHHLRAQGLPPGDLRFPFTSISVLCNRVLSFPDVHFAGCSAPWNVPGPMPRCRCGLVPYNLGKQLRDSVARFAMETQGLCLDCIKTQLQSGLERRCRFHHVKPRVAGNRPGETQA